MRSGDLYWADQWEASLQIDLSHARGFVIRRYDLWLSIIALFLILVFEASRAPFELFNIHHVLTNWNIGIFPIQVLKRFNLQFYTIIWYGVRYPKFIWTPVYSCTHWLRPLSPHLGSYTRALLVSQDRRHLLVTPCEQYLISLTKRCHDWTGCVNSLAAHFRPRDFGNIFENPRWYMIHLFERIIKCCCGARNNAFCLYLNVFVKKRRRLLLCHRWVIGVTLSLFW